MRIADFINKLGLAALVAIAAGPLEAMDFNLVKGDGILTLESGSSADQQLAGEVYSCFQQAASAWAVRFNDDITVNVVVDYDSLGSSVLGNSYSGSTAESYSSVKTALTSDAVTSYDFTAVSNLQGGNALDFVTNDTSSPSYAGMIRDNDYSTNNRYLSVNSANAKALGLISAHSTQTDATITFTSDFDWDFDRSDGIDFYSFDFTGVAIHEIGHALGFTSGVDIVDYYSQPYGGTWGSLEDYSVFSVADLYRYSDYSTALSGQPSSGAVLELSTYNDTYMSIDGGVTKIADMSTGEFNGDGYQGSHWLGDSGTGIMEPYSTNGQQFDMTNLDLLALDVIGFDRTAASLGDFNDDGQADADDIDMLLDELLEAGSDATFDVSFDLELDNEDLLALLTTFVGATEADANLSGSTDIYDFLILRSNYGRSGQGWADGDFTGEGIVNIYDFLYLRGHYGDALATSYIYNVAEANVPEPASFLILAFGAFAAMFRRKYSN